MSSNANSGKRKQLRFLQQSSTGSSAVTDEGRLRASSIDGIHSIEPVVDDRAQKSSKKKKKKQSGSAGRNGRRPLAPPVGSGSGSNATIFEEAEDCLAQSLLIFLYADLRLLSSTGRISTKFETLCIASDQAERTTAEHMAGISGDYASLVDDENTSEGISPAQIMAVLMIELRKEVLAWRKTRRFEEETSIMSTIYDKSDRKKVEDDMHAGLRCYNLMVGEDLRYDIPEFTASQPGTFRRPRELVDLIRQHMEEQRQERQERQSQLKRGGAASAVELPSVQGVGADSASDTEVDVGDNSPGKMSAATAPASDGEGEAVRRHSAASSEVNDTAAAATEATAELNKSRSLKRTLSSQKIQTLQEEFQQRRERVMEGVQRQTEVLRQGEDAVARHQFEDVGDAFVRMAQEGGIDTTGDLGTYRRKLSEEELLDYMEKAVESRDASNLDFMSSFFKDGSVSQVMVKSPARVVWLNDWYPLKDCTYGISVDKERKRVLLVFRGAITRADWGHAGKMDLKRVANPIQGDGLSKHIKVHNGFYRFLFRKRKDTGTRKYDEIANILHHYGSRFGDDYSLVVTGYSLGGALSTIFSLYASTDEKFTNIGPIQLYTFGCPYVGGLAFYESFRHQERKGKLQLVRFFNKRDGIAHLPVSWTGEYQHVGIGVRLPKVRSRLMRYLVPEPIPEIRYPKDKNRLGFYLRSLKENYFFNMPLPWKIRETHGLNELQKRMLRARVLSENGQRYPLHNMSLSDLYDALVFNNEDDKSGRNGASDRSDADKKAEV